MKFKGTIIITDPCYVVKDTEDLLKEAGITIEYPQYEEDLEAYREAVHKYNEITSPYDDWKKCDYGSRMERLGFTSFISESTIYGDWSCTTWSTPRTDIENQVEEINDLYSKRWNAINEYGENSVQSEVYDNKCREAIEDLNKLGYFCADAGMVSVFLLDEVLKYNPGFSKWIEEHPWCVTVIKDFDGDVQYYVDNSGNAHIAGKGNINFFTMQTGA